MCFESVANAYYTDPVPKNLTLALDEDLLLAARKAALDQNTSVNQLVREFFERLVEENEQRRMARKTIEHIFRQGKTKIGGISWSREYLHAD